jgi:hypothetical protein
VLACELQLVKLTVYRPNRVKTRFPVSGMTLLQIKGVKSMVSDRVLPKTGPDVRLTIYAVC